MIITREFLESFNPCKDRWENYLTHYSDWEGTLLEFMELDKISDTDKIWVFTRKIPELEKIQRKFAVACMLSCLSDSEELTAFQYLIALLYESNDYESIENLKDDEYRSADLAAYRAPNLAAYWVEYRAADWAAQRAAYRAADLAADWVADQPAARENQVLYIIGLLEEYEKN